MRGGCSVMHFMHRCWLMFSRGGGKTLKCGVCFFVLSGGSCWGQRLCGIRCRLERAQVERDLRTWDRRFSGWEGDLSLWDRYLRV